MYFVFLANLQKKEIIRILKIGTLRIRKHLLFCGTFGNELVKTLNNNNFEAYWPTLKYTRAHDLPANLRALKSSLQCPKLQSRPSLQCVGQYKKGGQIFGQDKHHIAVLQKQDFRTSKKKLNFHQKNLKCFNDVHQYIYLDLEPQQILLNTFVEEWLLRGLIKWKKIFINNKQ